jgi:hypothetical protein
MTSQTERQRGATQSPSLEGSKPGLDVSPGLSGLPKGRDSGPERPRGYAPPIHFSTGKIHMESSREKTKSTPQPQGGALVPPLHDLSAGGTIRSAKGAAPLGFLPLPS